METLILGLKLSRAGLKDNMLSPGDIKKELEEFWELIGQKHFRIKEEVLFPLYAIYGDLEEISFLKILIEQVKIRSLIYQILNEEDPNIKLMNTLGKLLNKHVREEEKIQRTLPVDVL